MAGEAADRGGPTLLTTGGTAQAVVTAGAAATWKLLREIVVVNETTGDVKITLGIYTSAADAAGRRITPPALVLHAGESWQWSGFLPLMGGSTPELLYALCDTNNGATVTVGLVDGP